MHENATPPTAVKPSSSPLAVLFLTVFLDLLGFGMVIPILQLYGKRFDASDVQTGFLLAIYSIMQLIFSPIWGRLSDRAGRRPILLLSILGSCGSQLGFAFAPTYTWLVIARGFAGVCGANVTAAQAYIADVTDAKSRAAGMGLLGAAFGLGFVFGPAIGSLLAHWSPRLPFLVAGALAGCNFVLAFLILGEPRPREQRSQARTLTWPGLVRAVTTPRLLVLLVLFFIVTFGFANLEGTFPLYLDRQFHYTQRQIGLMFTYIGVLMIVVQGWLVRRLVPRFGERRLVIAGTLLMALGFYLQYTAAEPILLYVAVAIVAVGNGLNTPSLSSLISRSASGDEQGGVLGVSQALGALARIAGPIVGTFTLAFGATMPYLTGAGAMLAACVFAAASVRQPES
jgi:multidrug resistance protein